MAGCYGNHPEDRYFERELYTYLDSQWADEDGFEAACDAADDERKRRKEESLELDK